MRFLAHSWDGTGFTLFFEQQQHNMGGFVRWNFSSASSPFSSLFSLPHPISVFRQQHFCAITKTRIEQSDDELSSLSPRQQHTACSHTRYRAAAGLYMLCIFCVQRGNHKWWLVPPRVPQAGVVFCALYVAWGWTPALSMHCIVILIFTSR